MTLVLQPTRTSGERLVDLVLVLVAADLRQRGKPLEVVPA
jgi:hypothetical protein